jgi:hypothetical protein
MEKRRIKTLFTELLAISFLVVLVFALCQDVYAWGQVELKVLNPRADLMSAPATPINPRLKTLAGKKIAIVNNTKPGADSFQPYLMQVLKESYPDIEFKVWNISYNDYRNKANDLKSLAAWSDGVIGLLGD